MVKRKETVVVKDYGNITVPTSWEEVKLKDFVSLMRLQDEENKTDISMQP